jgi:hypothetical protein
MSTWHRQVSKSLTDAVSTVLKDMVDDKASSQNNMMKKKGESIPSKSAVVIPEDDEEKNGKKSDPVDSKADNGKNGDKDGDKDGLDKKRKAISKAIRNTSANSKKIKLSKKKEDVKVNPSLGEETLSEVTEAQSTVSGSKLELNPNNVLEPKIDVVFQYSNKEEEAFREQWYSEFDSLVAKKDPHAYIDPLQKKVFYIEGITPVQAAAKYLKACIANAALAGGQYQEVPLRGGDPVASSQLQGQGQTIGNVYPARHQIKY